MPPLKHVFWIIGLGSFLLLLASPSLHLIETAPENAKAAEPSLSQARRFKYEGEYGLWVQVIGGRVDVRWLTARADSGFLQVYEDDAFRQELRTSLSQSHQAILDRGSAKHLKLRYGALSHEDDQHETLIYLEERRGESVFDNVDSVYVLGDIHGQFDDLTSLLGRAGLIDAKLRWKGGNRHLVALGDIFDRGHDVTRTLWLLYGMAIQAEHAGGKIHVVLGNHEIMTFCSDLRYLSGKENLVAQLHGTSYSEMYDVRHSILGRWLAAQPAILKINNVLLAHGGVTQAYLDYTIASFNDSLRSFMQEDIFQDLLGDSATTSAFDSLKHISRLRFFFAENTVFWYRGYVQTDTLQSELDEVLSKFQSDVHVVAHTPVPTIRDFYDGKVIAVDLFKPATEMLLMAREASGGVTSYKVDLNGDLSALPPRGGQNARIE